jgi:predicted nucleic acid-binding Zn ribbon protein
MLHKSEITLKEAIDNLLSNYKLKDKVVEARLQEQWPAIAGPLISRHTREVQLKNHKLIIRVDSAVVRQELSYVRTKIKDKVNHELGGDYVLDVQII